MKTLCVTVIVLLLTSRVIAQENEDPTELLVKGAQQLRDREWGAAERTFLSALKYWPDHPDVRALLGISRYHQEKLQECLADFEFALENRTRYKARSLYYLAIVYSKLGRQAEAKKVSDRLVAECPDTAEARKLAASMAAPVSRPEKKEKPERWKTFFLQGVSYDSNAPRVSGGEDDTEFLTFLSVTLEARPLPVNLNLSFFAREYVEQDEFDLAGLEATIEGELKLSENDTIWPQLTLQQLWLDDKKLEDRNWYGLFWKRKWGDKYFSDLHLRYGQRELDEVRYESLDGIQSSGRLRLWWYCPELKPLTRIRLLGELLKDKADIDYLGYQSWKVGVETRLTLPWEVVLEIGITYSQRLYDDIHPDYGLQRLDDRFKAELCALRSIAPWVFLWFRVSYLSSHSNINRYTYDQTVSGIGIMILF